MAIHRNIRLLALHNFFTDFVLFAPVAILYFARITGSYALGMSIFSIAYVSGAVFEVPTGVVSDYVGRKQTIILGSLFSVLCIVLYAIGGAYWVLAVGAVLQGISRAFFSGNNDALLHDSLSETNEQEQYHVHLGKTSAMFQVGLGIASLLGGVLANISYAWVMWLSVIPQVGAFVTASFIKEPRHSSRTTTNIYAHLREALSAFFSNKKLQSLSLASIFRFSLGEAAFFFRQAFVASLWPLWAVGISTMLSHVTAAISFFYSGTIIKRLKPIRVLSIEIITNRIINLTALLFPTIFSPALMGSTSLLFGAGTVTLNALMQKEFTQKQRATMSSVNAFAGSIAFGIFSIILGAVGDRIGVTNALIIIHLLLFIPLVFYWRVSKYVESPLQ